MAGLEFGDVAQREGRWAIMDLVDKVTPHDLHRTFAKLAHQDRTPLEQIQISLGHASIQTTER